MFVTMKFLLFIIVNVLQLISFHMELHNFSKEKIKYSPLKFHIHFKESSYNLSTLKRTFKEATDKVSQLLLTVSTEGSLLLERTCKLKWTSGANINKCAASSGREFCENKLDKFIIPENHLQQLDIFNSTGQDPISSFPAGEGVVDADFIVYVKVVSTTQCRKDNVYAYSSHCRRNQFGRPIAGYINFCPSILDGRIFEKNYVFNVAIHEIFHSLGFSKDLFPQFCAYITHEGICETNKNLIMRDYDGTYRLGSKNVIRKMMEHFNCSDEDFGAPLETDDNGSFGSHWDSYLLHGSIMASKMLEPEYVSIDPITLAVFEDSGWYHVNYTAADPYVWGQGGGCEFGSQKSCSTSNTLCSVSPNNFPYVGCDFQHLTKGFCEKIEENNNCGIYKPNVSADCTELSVRNKGIRYYKACFMSKNESNEVPLCLAYKCKSKLLLQILIDDSWYNCSSNNIIDLNNNVSVICPMSDILCSEYETSILQLQSSSAILLHVTCNLCILLQIILFLSKQL